MGSLASVFVGAGVLAAAGIISTVAVSITGRVRLWPPGEDTWKAALHWGLVGVVDVCLIVLAILRWDTWLLPRPASLVAGVVLSLLGAGVFLGGSRELTGAETAGQVPEGLRTSGLYARSRNPQYVGMMVGLVGFACLVNAVTVAVLCALYVGWLALLPLAEEPWLSEHFGEAYERYRQRVPRFVGRRTFERD